MFAAVITILFAIVVAVFLVELVLWLMDAEEDARRREREHNRRALTEEWEREFRRIGKQE